MVIRTNHDNLRIGHGGTDTTISGCLLLHYKLSLATVFSFLSFIFIIFWKPHCSLPMAHTEHQNYIGLSLPCKRIWELKVFRCWCLFYLQIHAKISCVWKRAVSPHTKCWTQDALDMGSKQCHYCNFTNFRCSLNFGKFGGQQFCWI